MPPATPGEITLSVSYENSKTGSIPGGVTLPEGITVKSGTIIGEPETPALPEGWVFVGWSSDPDNYTPFLFASPITGDTIIYAFYAETGKLPDSEITDLVNDGVLPIRVKVEFDENTNGYAFSRYSNANVGGTLTIPEYINGIPVTRISGNVFQDCGITGELIIPDTIKEIGVSAFADNEGITSVRFGKGLKSIDDSAFVDCRSLASIEFTGDSLESIGASAFRGAAITELDIPEGTVEIRQQAFIFCNKLESLTIPSTIQYIGAGAFAFCTALESITIAENTENLSLTEDLDITITYDDVTYSGILGAFTGCTGLKTINGSDAIVNIGDSVFADCTGFTELVFPNPEVVVSGMAFGGLNEGQIISFPNIEEPSLTSGDKFGQEHYAQPTSDWSWRWDIFINDAGDYERSKATFKWKTN